jgi:S1-C subfamily serine protease
MMEPRRAFASLALALLLAAPLGGAEAQDGRSAVVQIRNNKTGKVGSGFVIRVYPAVGAYILTVAHVVAGDKEPTVTFFGHPDLPMTGGTVRMEGADDRDLALILVNGNIPSSVTALSLASFDAIREGDSVTVLGFPRVLGTPWAVVPGQVLGRRGGRDITIGARIEEGNSGGPVLRGGQVIGIVWSADGQTGYATPASVIRATVDGWGIERLRETSGAFCETLERLDGVAWNRFKDLSHGK